MHKIILYIIFFLIPFVSFSQKNDAKKISVNEYLNQYNAIAIKEMERQGVKGQVTNLGGTQRKTVAKKTR